MFLAGTKVDDAKALIATSGLRILPVDNLEDAARLVSKITDQLNLKMEYLDLCLFVPCFPAFFDLLISLGQ